MPAFSPINELFEFYSDLIYLGKNLIVFCSGLCVIFGIVVSLHEADTSRVENASPQQPSPKQNTPHNPLLDNYTNQSFAARNPATSRCLESFRSRVRHTTTRYSTANSNTFSTFFKTPPSKFLTTPNTASPPLLSPIDHSTPRQLPQGSVQEDQIEAQPVVLLVEPVQEEQIEAQQEESEEKEQESEDIAEVYRAAVFLCDNPRQVGKKDLAIAVSIVEALSEKQVAHHRYIALTQATGKKAAYIKNSKQVVRSYWGQDN
ncbi:hypothetical protein BJ508DRAFT_334325 [Ascobolus immersus RN42]|uniref:Uncharacterized protein n=1 Tax=Ascobolus immersus RN42 TaxID=1160509 RepID=A0A3N4HM89_ASCIM|nr:hypothetical protein BJ508DRAFT_334325 [Ascobolus immersus RN42]